MASLSLRHVYKKYPGNVVAVKDFNLEIEDKEFIIFVGPSGCGRSKTKSSSSSSVLPDAVSPPPCV